MCHVIVVRQRGRRRPASPTSSTVSYERDDLAVIQYNLDFALSIMTLQCDLDLVFHPVWPCVVQHDLELAVSHYDPDLAVIQYNLDFALSIMTLQCDLDLVFHPVWPCVVQHDLNLAVIQYDPASCENGVTSCYDDRHRGHHHHHHDERQNLTWPPPPSDEKALTPSSTTDRCQRPACSQDGGHCPLDAASSHCRRCSAALRAISQSVCCSRRTPPCPAGDVTSGSDVTTSGVSRVTESDDPDGSGSQDLVNSDHSQ